MLDNVSSVARVRRVWVVALAVLAGATSSLYAGNVKFLDSVTIYQGSIAQLQESGLLAFSSAILDDGSGSPSVDTFKQIAASTGTATTDTAQFFASNGDLNFVDTTGIVTSSLNGSGGGPVNFTANHTISVSGSSSSAGSFSEFGYVGFIEVLDSSFNLSGSFTVGANVSLAMLSVDSVRTSAADPATVNKVQLFGSDTYNVILEPGIYAISFLSHLDAVNGLLVSSSEAALTFAPAASSPVPLPSSAIAGSVLFAPLVLRRKR